MTELDPALKLRFGVYLPSAGWDRLPTPSELVEYALAAEEMGFDSVWVEDRLLHPRMGILEALTTLTFVASRTTRIGLGTSVLLVNLRNPLVLAKMIGSLDYLSGGRVIVGASLGGSPEEYEEAGISIKTRVSRFTRTIRAMRAWWGQGSPDAIGMAARTAGVVMEPKPVQQRIPVWIGGRAEPVLQRVAALGDGWLASSTTTAEEFASGWMKISEAAQALGRDIRELEPAKFSYIHVDESAERTLATLTTALSRYYSFPYDASRFALYGPPARCIEGAEALLTAGVRTLIFSTVTLERRQLERIAQEIVPALRLRAGR